MRFAEDDLRGIEGAHPRRRRHPHQRAQLVVDALERGDARPDGLLRAPSTDCCSTVRIVGIFQRVYDKDADLAL